MEKKLLSVLLPVFFIFLGSWSGFGQDCTGTASVTITSNATNNTICAGETVTFTATPTRAGTSPKFQWRINGLNQTSNTTTNTFLTSNLQNGDVVTVALTPDCASAGIVISNGIATTVNPKPTVNVGGAINPICQGGSTSALGGSFGGGATGAIWTASVTGGTFTNNTGNNPGSTTYTASTTISAPTTITLTLTTSGGSCGTVTATKTLTVNPNPTVSAGSPLAPICQGGTTVALGGSFGGGATSAVWSDGGAGGTFNNNSGNTPNSATYTAAANAPSTVNLTLTTSGGSCGTTSATKSLTVNKNPIVDAGGNIAVFCQGGTTGALGGSFGGGATSAIWSASVAGGTFSTNNTGTSPGSVTYTAPANAPASIILTLTTSGGSCGSAIATKTLTINPNPTVSAGSAVAAICQGGTTADLGGSFGGGATSAVWSDGGAGGTFTNNSGNSPNTARYIAAANAPATVTLTLTTAGGSCQTVSASKTLTVNPNPTVSAGGAVAAICQGGTTVALGGSFGGGATGAVWTANVTGGTFSNNGGTTPNTATYTAPANAPASIVLTLTTTGGSCGQAIATKTLTVNQNVTPSVSITSSSTNVCTTNGRPVIFTATPINGGTSPTYQWRRNNTVIPGETGPTYTATSSQSSSVITVVMTSNAVCPSPTTATSNGIALNAFAGAPSNWGGGVKINMPSSVCPPATEIFSIPPVDGAEYYEWTLPQGFSITAGNGTNTITVAIGSNAIVGNSQDVKVQAFNPCGNNNVQTDKINVNNFTGVTVPTPTAVVCAGNSITVVGTLRGNAATGTWSAPSGNFTNVTTSSTNPITVTATYTPTITSGSVDLTITTNAPAGRGCSNTPGTATITLTVNQSSVAPTSLSSTTTTVCNGQSTILSQTGGSLGTGASWKWYSNAGFTTLVGTSTDANASLSVSPSATTTYYLRAESTTGSPCIANVAATGSVTVTVNQPSVAPTSLVASTSTICNGSSTTLTQTGGSLGTGASWKWYSNAGFTTLVGTSTDANASLSVSPSATTTYYLRAESTTGSPCIANVAATGSVTVTVNQPSVAPTSIVASTATICNGGNITLTQTGGSLGTGASWKWYSNAGFTTLVGTSAAADASLSVSPSTTTTYYLRAESTTGSPCIANVAAAGSVTVTVNQPSVAPASVVASTATICNGTSATLTQTGGSLGTGASWKWYSNSEFTSESLVGTSTEANASLSVTPTANTTYYLRAESTTGSPCIANVAAAGSVTVTVNQPSVAPASVVASTATICNGTSTTLTQTGGSLGTGASWKWYSTANFTTMVGESTATDAILSVTPSATTTYYLRAESTTGSPCIANVAAAGSVTVTVNQPVAITTQPNPTQTVCSGFPVSLTVAATGTGLTYEWFRNGTSIGITTPTISFERIAKENAGTYTVAVRGTSPCESTNSNPAVINVIEDIVIDEQPINSEICEGNPASFRVETSEGNISGYRWRKDGISIFDGGNISGTTTKQLTIADAKPGDSGKYDVVISTTDDTCSQTITNPATLKVNPNSTISLSSAAGTDNQTNCINSAITPITYAIGGGGTGASITGGALPAGVTGVFNAGVFTISGTPSVAGTFNYTVTTTGNCANVNLSGTINVTPGNTIQLNSNAATANQELCVNTSITNIIYTTTGATGADFSGLPAGVTGTWANNTATISGTPTAATTAGGQTTYTVTLTGGCSVVTTTGTISVNPDNAITLSSAATTNAQSVCVNTPLTNITYTTTGATGATFSGLPAGINGVWANNIVTISGTPTAAGGPSTFTVTLKGGCTEVTATGTINVNPNNTIVLSQASGSNSQTVCENTPLTNITYTTTGATGATFSGLPPGVTGAWANNTVTISGTPTAATPSGGQTTYIVTLTGGCGTETATGTITVNPNNAVALSSASGTNAQSVCINTPLTNITYTTTGATGATVTGLPAGLNGTWANNIVTISGTPTAATLSGGQTTYTVTLTGGCSAVTTTGTINVDPVSVAGTLTAPASVCVNNASGQLVLSENAGNIVKWESKAANATTWSVLNGGNTAATQNFSNLTQTTTFRATVKSGVCSEATVEKTITIDPLPVGGNLAFADIVTSTNDGRIFTICQGATTGYKPIILTGQSGTILAWKYSINGAEWVAIAGETTNILSASKIQSLNLSATTVFRVEIGSGACTPNAFSNTAILSVIPTNIEPPSISVSDGIVCMGESVTLTSDTGYSSPNPIIEDGTFDNAGIKNNGWRFLLNGQPSNFNTNANNLNDAYWSRATPHDFITANINNPFNTTPQRWAPGNEEGNKGFAIVSGPQTNATMETNTFRIGPMDQAVLTFDQAFNLTPGATIKVEISKDGGNTYEKVLFTRTGSATSGNYSNFGTVNNSTNRMVLDLGEYLGQNNLRVRFSYTGTRRGDIWAIDAIKVPSGPRNVTIEWNDYTNPAQVIPIGTTNSVSYAPKEIGLNVFEFKTKLEFDSSGNVCPVAVQSKSIEVFVFDKYTTTATQVVQGCGDYSAQLGATVVGTIGGNLSANFKTAGYTTPDGYVGEWVITPTAGYTLINPDPTDTRTPKNNPEAILTASAPGDFTVTWSLIPVPVGGKSYTNSGCQPVTPSATVSFKDCIALDFDGINDFVDLGEGYIGDYSIEAWIRPYTRTKPDGSNTDASKGTIISTPQLEINMTDLSGLVTTNGRWYHIAVDSDGKLYVDGIDANKTITAKASSNRSLIGARWTAPNAANYFSGWIEEVRIWKNKITDKNIRFTMNQRLKGSGNIGVEVDMPHDDAPVFNNLAGYYQLLSSTILNGGYTKNLAGTVDGKLRNMTTSQENTAPLPYYTANNGNWDTPATWAQPEKWKLANTGGIDWNIVKLNNDVQGKRDISVLGLISESGTLDMEGNNPDGWETGSGGTGNPLTISHYLLLKGVIDLNGESQLLQPLLSIVADGSTGALQRDQQGTANSFNYNYWSSPVSSGVSNSPYTVAGVLKDESTTPTNIVPVTFGDPHGFADAGKTNPVKISNYWISTFNGTVDNYGSWNFQYGSAEPINVGEGYTMKGTSGAVALSTTQNYTFVGLPNNGDIILPSFSDRNYLLGNPYPSAMDAEEFILDNLGARNGGTNYFDGALYFWNHFGKKDSHVLLDYVGGYATLNLSGAVPAISFDERIDDNMQENSKIPGDYIPVGQGFFVNTSNGYNYTVSSGQIKFRNSQREFIEEVKTTGSQFLRPEVQTKEAKKKEKEKIRISYKSPLGYNRQILVAATPNATNGFDLGYDAPLFDYNKEDMYWIQESNWLVIQGVGHFEKNQVLPLGVVLDKKGEFTIKIDELENIASEKMIYLKDKKSDSIHDLRKSAYKATAEGGYHNDRFEIIFYKEIAAGEEPPAVIKPNPKDPDGGGNGGEEITDLTIRYSHTRQEVQILNPNQVTLSNMYIFDLNGNQLINHRNISHDKDVRIPVRNYSSGMYIVKLYSEGAVISKKIIINN